VPTQEPSQEMTNHAQVVDDVADAASTVQMPLEHNAEPEHDDEGSQPGEATVSAEVGSNEGLDLVDEDLQQDESTLATGFIGKASEIQWLRRMPTHGVEQKRDGPYGPPGQTVEAAAERLNALRLRQQDRPTVPMRTSKASFYLDDEVFKMDHQVDPFELPSFELAEKLLQTYLDSCHNSFPFFSRKTLEKQFYHCTYGAESQRLDDTGYSHELP
jgi:hypothetical protein